MVDTNGINLRVEQTDKGIDGGMPRCEKREQVVD